ncbi:MULTISPECIES: hypothetical protein [Pseudomonas]|uniref:Uncharacterized protein n=1 Tax=Pseudomonas fluorescens TaxID=294 RepID=A0A166QKW8_PSEFL|nr:MULTISPECIES: hypothetical protein [Pseudomonas]KZN20443.1 hypothetical protein A1D17_02570 [Pseudomonas fluorescens]
MTNEHILALNALTTPEDFAGQYAALLDQHDPDRRAGFTSFEVLIISVKRLIEARSPQEGRDEMLDFEDFQDFLEWYEQHTAYFQMAPEIYVPVFKLLLEVVYRALVAAYKAQVQDDAFVEGTPDATMHVVMRLKAMHPEMLWGTVELGDYDQVAYSDAPAIVIYFAQAFSENSRNEMPDAYANIFGSPVEPSANGMSEEAAKLLREHNKINFVRDLNCKKFEWAFITVEGVEASLKLAGKLLLESAAFNVVPLPDDFYEFSVKEDRKHLLLKAE